MKMLEDKKSLRLREDRMHKMGEELGVGIDLRGSFQ